MATDGDTEAAEEFLTDWAENHGLADATLRIETGDVEDAIERVARDHSLVVLGATERGMLSRLIRRSLTLDVVEELDCSVLLAERPQSRSLVDRLFGR